MKNCYLVTVYLMVLIFVGHYNTHAQTRNIDSLIGKLNIKNSYWSSPLGRVSGEVNIADEYQLTKAYDKSNDYLHDAGKELLIH